MHMGTYGGALSALHPVIGTICGSLDDGLQEAQEYHNEKMYRRVGA